MIPEIFLQETYYIDYRHPLIEEKAAELFAGITDDIEKARTAYIFVRDEIPHMFDIRSHVVTVKASEVLREKTGICHAKANLLAALLRHEGIPCGFCFEHMTLADDDSLGYCVHGYNAVYLNGKWVQLDARGNKPGVSAQFSLDEPVLAFIPRPKKYDEYFYPGIYARPQKEMMEMLEKAHSMKDIIENIPSTLSAEPDLLQ